MVLMWLGVALVVVVAAWLGWLAGTARSKANADAAHVELSAKRSAAEAIAGEVRLQLQSEHSESGVLRERLAAAEAARVAAETLASETARNLVEDKVYLEKTRAKLSDTFKALAADALAGNNEGFLVLASQRFKALRDESVNDLDARRHAVDALVEPLKETLAAYQREAKELEEKRLREVSAVGKQLELLATAQSGLQKETSKLVNALRSPQVRGRWGEITLRRTAELAGMVKYCDFLEQETVTTEAGRSRPDMIVKLPAGRDVVVDSKVPLGAFLEALDATTDEGRDAAMTQHAAQLRQHVDNLASKEYWSQFTTSPEFVVLFIPNDSFLAAAADRDPPVVERALAKKVLIATPATFIGLLQAIAYGWRQEQIAANSERISRLGQELGDRIGAFAEHLNRLGASLGKAVESYNAAVGSLEARVLPAARRFKSLGTGAREIEEVNIVEANPRPLMDAGGMATPDELDRQGTGTSEGDDLP